MERRVRGSQTIAGVSERTPGARDRPSRARLALRAWYRHELAVPYALVHLKRVMQTF